ncbi:MAG: hypothetical protein ACYTG0_31300 [Planctomycetota bacterium]|jgi:hypothetical protein
MAASYVRCQRHIDSIISTGPTIRKEATGGPKIPVVQALVFCPVEDKLFGHQYGIRESVFTLAQSCVDFDHEGHQKLDCRIGS